VFFNYLNLMSTCNWTVWDVLSEKSVGTWTDISYAEEFVADNEGPDDLWTVVPDLEAFVKTTKN